MASMAVYLRSQPRSLLRSSAACSSSSFSSSSSSSTPDPDDGNTQNEAGSSKSFGSLLSHLKQAEQSPNTGNAQTKPGSSFFGDLKSSLKEGDQNPPPPPPLKQFSFSQGAGQQFNKQQAPSLDAIRNTLSRFKNAHPDPRSIGPRSHPPLFTEIYRKNAAESDRAKSSGQSISFLKDHLRQGEGSRGGLGMSSRLTDSLNRKPAESTMGNSFGEASELPQAVFGKELNEKSKDIPKNALVMDYTAEELGKKLQTLRPGGVKEGENWFSLSELNERLVKLRKMDTERYSGKSVDPLHTVREVMRSVKFSDAEAARKKIHQGISLAPMGATPNYMLEPPKEQLVEKYFHPDNMSSAEKMKLELKRVRDEFKMSETDCGSTRVQMLQKVDISQGLSSASLESGVSSATTSLSQDKVAQLTTEINHLSKVLHKKDKHSIKGLQGKVQMRKKLLKYLRRTDWDSYCFILSKLGLRDNPGYKQH